MDKQRIITVTSTKGGVGKSTVCANLGLALARRGKKVLLLDCDFGMSCLELLFGKEDQAIFNYYDAITGCIPSEKVILRVGDGDDGKTAALYFCPAPGEQEGERIGKSAFSGFLSEAEALLHPDFILLDTKGDLGHSFQLAASVAGRAAVIATHHPAAMRGAEKTASALFDAGVTPMLIVNLFEPDATDRIKRRFRAGLLEMVDRTGVGLLGVVPAMPDLALGQERGLLADRAGKNTLLPFSNIAARLCGEAVPLFYGMKRRKKLKENAL